MFLPGLVGELEAISFKIGQLIVMTPHGGHVGYVSSQAGQKVAEDPHHWWVWNRMFQWCDGLV